MESRPLQESRPPDGPVRAAKLDVGRVFRLGVGVTRRNWPTFLLFGGVLVAAPAFIEGLSALDPDTQSPRFVRDSLQLTLWIGGNALLLLGQAIAIPAVMAVVISDLFAERVPVATSLRIGVARALPFLQVTWLVGILAVLGLTALLAPGLWILAAFVIAIPAGTFEDRGLGQAFGNSLFLTHGNRWRVLGVVLSYISAWLIGGAFLAGAGSGGDLPAAAARLIVQPLAQGLAAVGGGVLLMVLYFELRRIRTEPEEGAP